MERTIGERIKKLRLQHNMTLKEMGEAINFNYSNLSKIERGIRKPHIDFLQKIAEYFDIEITYFFNDVLLRSEDSSRPNNMFADSIK